jgi:flagellar biosynthetic protein FlhB
MDDRTEAPTPRRREEAREKGQVAKSVEINSAVLMLAAFWLFSLTGRRFYEGLTTVMRRSFDALPAGDLTVEMLFSATLAIIGQIAWIMAPFSLILLLVGVLSNFSQVGPLLTFKALQPDPNKINPLNGLKRLFSLRSLVDLLKSILKVVIVGLVIYITVRDNYNAVLSTSRMDLAAGVITLARLAIQVGFRVGMIMIVIGAFDFVYQRYEHEKSLRMTKQEIKEEHRRYENPLMKSRIRARQRQLAMSRMMAAIPDADVVLTNPTHLAVVLCYEQGKMQAPQVVAKGERLVAERIKKLAREHNVPVMENKPLARSLYKLVDIGQSIPGDLYQAVAEVMAFVYRLKPRSGMS